MDGPHCHAAYGNSIPPNIEMLIAIMAFVNIGVKIHRL